MQEAYQPDLARIHHEGYGGLAEHAAEVLLTALRARGLEHGTIIDLGCGSGRLAAPVSRAGYDVLGIDQSESMLAIAQKVAPAARFQRGSSIDAELPPSIAVVAIGEIFNYALDPRASLEAFAGVVGKIKRSLAPGGIFLFDVAGPGRAGPTPRHHMRQTEDWLCVAEATEAEDGGTLTRSISTFHREGAHWRRHDERHLLKLFAPEAVMVVLSEAGFQAEHRNAYGTLALPSGLHAFFATC
ncbi:MAG TPA: class I SAM-dependent methyltransferase [Polyangia bacterium]